MPRKVGCREKQFLPKILFKSIFAISFTNFGWFQENKITYIPIIQINREKKRLLLGNSIFLGGPRPIWFIFHPSLRSGWKINQMGLEPPWKKNFPQKSFFIPLFLNNRYINRYYLPDKDFMVPYFSANFIFHPYETKFCGIEKWYAGTEKWYAGTEK